MTSGGCPESEPLDFELACSEFPQGRPDLSPMALEYREPENHTKKYTPAESHGLPVSVFDS